MSRNLPGACNEIGRDGVELGRKNEFVKTEIIESKTAESMRPLDKGLTIVRPIIPWQAASASRLSHQSPGNPTQAETSTRRLLRLS